MSLFATWVCLFVNIVCLSVRSSLRARLLVCGLVCVQGLFFRLVARLLARVLVIVCLCLVQYPCVCVFSLLVCCLSVSLLGPFVFASLCALHSTMQLWFGVGCSLIRWCIYHLLVCWFRFCFRLLTQRQSQLCYRCPLTKPQMYTSVVLKKNTALGTDPKPYGLRLKL